MHSDFLTRLNMKSQDTLLNRHGVDGLQEVLADKVHGRKSLTPEEMMIFREELEANERAAMEALRVSQVEGPDRK